LPALVQFMNKTLDWNITEDYQKPLKVEMSPAPSVVSFANTQLIPSSGYGWQPKQPTLALPNVKTERPLTPDVPPLPNVKTASEPNAFGYVGLVDEANAAHQGDVATAPKTVQDTAFSDWLNLVKTRQLAPTMQPTKQFISERKLAKGIKLIAAMAEDWLDRAYNLGVLDENPDYGNGKSRYLLATGEGFNHVG
ncbi:MAG TPA: hypothetical protein PLM98_14200, partial [Thiolinea sp.]|nr:hypothetical protein [Thiolinea sp.]